MAKTTLPYLYREARLNLDPTSPTSTIRFTLPDLSSFPRLGSRAVQKRIADTLDEDLDQDEEGFAQKHLANEASIFFRRENSAPRCISWRLLEGRNVLELRVVDLTQKKGQEQNSKFTLSFQFPAAIRPFGITFADFEEQEAFNIFALTTEKELYTLTIHKNFFISQSVTDGKLGDWCQIYTHPAFGYRLPYRIFAVNTNELLVSLQDGGILRLERVSKGASWTWKDFIYSPGEAGWGASIRGFIPWTDHNVAQFEDLSLQPAASAAIAVSPEGNHLFTVCLNNILRIRDHKSGGVYASVDLLSQDNTDNKSRTWQLMNPRQRTLLQVVKPEIVRDGDLYYVVTYIPKDHQFKFWGVRDADEAVNGIYNIHPELKLIPPVDKLLDTSAWTLEDFHLKSRPFLQSTELWIRARVGTVSRVFALKFSLFDDDDFLQSTWESDWMAVDSGTTETSALRSNTSFPSVDAVESFAITAENATEKALDFIFYPERFTSATLESALCQYRTGLGLPSSRVQHRWEPERISLKQRICETIAEIVSPQLKTRDNLDLDSGAHQAKVAEQWSIFIGLIIELHRRRSESLSLAYDAKGGLPWLCLADFVSPIRKCSELELLQLNEDMLSRNGEDLEVGPIARSLQDRDSIFVGRFLSLASSFRQHLPKPVKDMVTTLASAEAFRDPFISLDERIQLFYGRCDFAECITEEDLSLLSGAFDAMGGVTELSNDLFRRTIARLDPETEGADQVLSLMTYGERMLVRGAQEMLEIGCNALLDLLVLVVVMAADFDESELPNNFLPAEIYGEIINRLKEYELLKYLASTNRVEPPSKEQSSQEKSKSLSSPGTNHKREDHHLPTVTLLWSIFIGDWKNIPTPEMSDVPMPSLLTYWIRSWALGPDLAENYDDIVADIMGNFLVHGDLDLAADFISFVPGTPWAVYLKSRLYLERNELAEAARGFKKASFALSRMSKNKVPLGAEQLKDVQIWDGRGLLAPHEVRCFNEGNVGPYYQHITELFERVRPQAWTFVAEFSRMSIWHFEQKRFMRKEAGVDDLDIIDQRKFGASQHRESQSSRRSRGGDNYTQRSPSGLRNSSLSGPGAESNVQIKDEGDDSLEDSMALIDYSIAELGAIKDYEARQESLSRLFTALVKTSRWEEAYATLVRYEKPDVRRWALKYFLQTLLSPACLAINPSAPSILLRLPLSAAPHANLAPIADAILLELARNPPSTTSSSFSAYLESDTTSSSKPRKDSRYQWWKILYAFRVSRSDYRGAAEALWEWLNSLRTTHRSGDLADSGANEIDSVFLLLINALASVDPEQAWLLAEVPNSKTRGGVIEGSLGIGMGMKGKKERKVITLDDVRKDYSAYLDQVAAVEQGRFAFVERDAEGDVSML
ncbi:MAG: hypothetical protein M1821_003548 [Bathelium mastoideum]|nr:MAG: hypothetical protein M1821_003548 [Bathelium mastoideum]